MPRVPDEFLDCTFYLYPSKQAANEGKSEGATGFIVSIPSEHLPEQGCCYGVTNRHVVSDNMLTLRFNTVHGETYSVQTTPEQWISHPYGDDLAVIPIVLPELFKSKTISINQFITKPLVQENNIGPGDDVFLVGRFVVHDGKELNEPSVRFGNISMMPSREGVLHPKTKLKQESFVVEVKTMPGYSGSPVFVYRPANVIKSGLEAKFAFLFLGIEWGLTFSGYAKVLDRTGKPLTQLCLENNVTTNLEDNTTPKSLGWYVESNTGLTNVIPAWKLAELLYQDELVQNRRIADEVWLKNNS